MVLHNRNDSDGMVTWEPETSHNTQMVFMAGCGSHTSHGRRRVDALFPLGWRQLGTQGLAWTVEKHSVREGIWFHADSIWGALLQQVINDNCISSIHLKANPQHHRELCREAAGGLAYIPPRPLRRLKRTPCDVWYSDGGDGREGDQI